MSEQRKIITCPRCGLLLGVHRARPYVDCPGCLGTLSLFCVRDGETAVTVREDGKPEGFPTELADVVIRCMDLADAMGIDLWAEMERKHAYNRTRTRRHGGKAL